MRNTWLVGIAALALSAAPALAQGKGNGGGDGGGHGGDGAGGADRGGGVQAAMPHGNGGGIGGGHDRGNGDDSGQHSAMQVSRQGHDVSPERVHGGGADSGGRRGGAVADGRGRGRDEARGKAIAANPGRDSEHAGDGPDRFRNRPESDSTHLRQIFGTRTHGLIDGCPPGLAAKHNGCTPPGQLRQQEDAWRNTLYQPAWWGYSGLSDGRYAYDNGYLYRLDNAGGIAGYLPLLGGALGIGYGWPTNYQPVRLPDYYQRYYGLGPVDTYRYADNVIYRVDPSSSGITSIAALLTGDNFGVGQRMPAGYDAYNIPYAYRGQYADSADAAYRYSDGYVYQVDPKTQLITAAIELLAGKVL
ncbi:MAG: hypothetical protein ABIP41_08700 [Croceibacterium sp.]